MTEETVLQVKRLNHAYKKFRALNDVSFTVQPRSIHGFIGPNGAGKTTTLRILSTLLKVQSGSVSMFGFDVMRHYKSIRKRIGFMPDHFSMYRQMTVLEYLDFFAAAYGFSSAKRRQTIKDVLELTDMAGRKDDFIHALSRGMQQRVSLARVLVHDPDLLLLDEPASGLDPRARIELMEILKELRRMGKTIFISSHILTELADLCDSVTIIDRGEIRYTGDMLTLQHEHQGEWEYQLVLSEPSEELAGKLSSLEGMNSVQPLDESGRYHLHFTRGTLTPTDVLRAVLEGGGEVISFQQDVKHLNQAFMDLTTPGVSS